MTRAVKRYGGGERPIAPKECVVNFSALFTEDMLPVPPETLSSGEITLRFAQVVPGEPSRGFVPYFHFRILAADGSDAGHINFRVGDTEHVRVCAGHIGFEIAEAFRGRRYALQACQAIAPFVRSIYRGVTITCDPDNLASRRTIERLGAEFVDEVAVPQTWRFDSMVSLLNLSSG